jgi:hypothetical protein
LARPARWLIVQTAGNLKVTCIDGTVITIPVPVGVIPLWVKRVWTTDTTAANITGLA